MINLKKEKLKNKVNKMNRINRINLVNIVNLINQWIVVVKLVNNKKNLYKLTKIIYYAKKFKIIVKMNLIFLMKFSQ